MVNELCFSSVFRPLKALLHYISHNIFTHWWAEVAVSSTHQYTLILLIPIYTLLAGSNPGYSIRPKDAVWTARVGTSDWLYQSAVHIRVACNRVGIQYNETDALVAQHSIHVGTPQKVNSVSSHVQKTLDSLL